MSQCCISKTKCRRGSNVIVIHPGSRSLRIGRASDVNPIVVSNVIARRQKARVPVPVFLEGISRPRNRRPKPQTPTPVENGDEYAVADHYDDPVRLRDTSKPCDIYFPSPNTV